MKKRLDVLLVEKGFVKSRSEALALIMSKKVKVNDKIIDKAGSQVKDDDKIELGILKNKFVSRGGFKLLKGLTEFKIDLKGKVCLDIGASTGGFTDCMLQHNAKKVYAVDVGYGQLDWQLRNNDRVINIEKTNFRNWNGEQILDKIDFVSIDVSFISLTKILPNLNNLLKKIDYAVLALIKPQFEVGKDKIGKKGVVRNPKYRQEVIENITKFVENMGYEIKGVCKSPIKGPAGNVEYLMYFENNI